jgi:uncharacterized membrane protein
MKPLVVLLITFFLALVGTKLFNSNWNYIFAGNLAMSVMLLFTAIGHFAFPKGMSMMIPKIIPFKATLVYLTGLIEIGAAVGLMIPSLRHIAAVLLIIFFVCILPANINAAINKVDFEKGTYTGSGLNYLWFRIPLQVLLIAWIVYFSL